MLTGIDERKMEISMVLMTVSNYSIRSVDTAAV